LKQCELTALCVQGDAIGSIDIHASFDHVSLGNANRCLPPTVEGNSPSRLQGGFKVRGAGPPFVILVAQSDLCIGARCHWQQMNYERRQCNYSGWD
jgi:hypothetical protein